MPSVPGSTIWLLSRNDEDASRTVNPQKDPEGDSQVTGTFKDRMEGERDGGRRKGQKQEHTVPAEPWGEEEGLFKDIKCHMFELESGARGHRSE